MNKFVYNHVEKRVGNCEDNSVDKQNATQDAAMPWLSTWSNYWCQAHCAQLPQSELAGQDMQKLIDFSVIAAV